MQYFIDDNTKQMWAFEDGVEITDPVILSKRSITEAQAQEYAAQIQNDLYNALPYGVKRAREYPSIGDQLDALYHAGMLPAELSAQISAIKAKYPKV